MAVLTYELDSSLLMLALHGDIWPVRLEYFYFEAQMLAVIARALNE